MRDFDGLLITEYRNTWLEKNIEKCFHMVQAFKDRTVFYDFACQHRRERLESLGHKLSEDGMKYKVWFCPVVEETYAFELFNYPRTHKDDIATLCKSECFEELSLEDFFEDLKGKVDIEFCYVSIWKDYQIDYEDMDGYYEEYVSEIAPKVY